MDKENNNYNKQLKEQGKVLSKHRKGDKLAIKESFDVGIISQNSKNEIRLKLKYPFYGEKIKVWFFDKNNIPCGSKVLDVDVYLVSMQQSDQKCLFVKPSWSKRDLAYINVLYFTNYKEYGAQIKFGHLISAIPSNKKWEAVMEYNLYQKNKLPMWFAIDHYKYAENTFIVKKFDKEWKLLSMENIVDNSFNSDRRGLFIEEDNSNEVHHIQIRYFVSELGSGNKIIDYYDYPILHGEFISLKLDESNVAFVVTTRFNLNAASYDCGKIRLILSTVPFHNDYISVYYRDANNLYSPSILLDAERRICDDNFEILIDKNMNLPKNLLIKYEFYDKKQVKEINSFIVHHGSVGKNRIDIIEKFKITPNLNLPILLKHSCEIIDEPILSIGDGGSFLYRKNYILITSLGIDYCPEILVSQYITSPNVSRGKFKDFPVHLSCGSFEREGGYNKFKYKCIYSPQDGRLYYNLLTPENIGHMFNAKISLSNKEGTFCEIKRNGLQNDLLLIRPLHPSIPYRDSSFKINVEFDTKEIFLDSNGDAKIVENNDIIKLSQLQYCTDTFDLAPHCTHPIDFRQNAGTFILHLSKNITPGSIIIITTIDSNGNEVEAIDSENYDLLIDKNAIKLNKVNIKAKKIHVQYACSILKQKLKSINTILEKKHGSVYRHSKFYIDNEFWQGDFPVGLVLDQKALVNSSAIVTFEDIKNQGMSTPSSWSFSFENVKDTSVLVLNTVIFKGMTTRIGYIYIEYVIEKSVSDRSEIIDGVINNDMCLSMINEDKEGKNMKRLMYDKKIFPDFEIEVTNEIDLIKDLKKLFNYNKWSETEIRDACCNFLASHEEITIEDISDTKYNYYLLAFNEMIADKGYSLKKLYLSDIVSICKEIKDDDVENIKVKNLLLEDVFEIIKKRIDNVAQIKARVYQSHVANTKVTNLLKALINNSLHYRNGELDKNRLETLLKNVTKEQKHALFNILETKVTNDESYDKMFEEAREYLLIQNLLSVRLDRFEKQTRRDETHYVEINIPRF